MAPVILLEELLDDDEVLPAGGQLLGLQQDLAGEGVLGGLGYVDVLEGVELPHAPGGGDGEQKVAGLGVGVGRPELDPAEGEASLVEQVAVVTEAEEGPENVVLLQGSGASALKSEHESVMRERGHRIAGLSWSVPVYLFRKHFLFFFSSRSKICVINNHIS